MNNEIEHKTVSQNVAFWFVMVFIVPLTLGFGMFNPAKDNIIPIICLITIFITMIIFWCVEK